MQRRMVKIGVAACVLALAVGGMSLAQQGGGGGRRNGGQGGGMRGDPAQFRQMMMERVKEQLGVTDDATWKVMEPRLQKVMELNMQARGGMGRGMMGLFGRGGRGGPGGDQGGQGPRRGGMMADTPMAKAMTNLQTVLENQSSSNDDIKKALTTVREARVKAQQDLAAAQADLKKILTVRQEAMLVEMGQLE